VAFVNTGSPQPSAHFAGAFRAGLAELGYVDGQNIAIEYYWLEGQSDRLLGLMAELVRRRIAVIATPGSSSSALAAKAATATIPIVFGVGDDPVRLGLVASLARPGGNATGSNMFSNEVVPKRLGLLHELVPDAKRVAVLVNPSFPANIAGTLREIEDSARVMGLSIDVHKASTSQEIQSAFTRMVQDQAKALFVGADNSFISRRVQLVTLAARHGIVASFHTRDFVEVGGLTSYGTDLQDMFRQVGLYVGRILKGAKPSDLPVLQSTKFEFAINLPTARALGIQVPPTLLAQADEVIE
jgi:putative tryptophan/tyrosine transport system substrate-binding protein